MVLETCYLQSLSFPSYAQFKLLLYGFTNVSIILENDIILCLEFDKLPPKDTHLLLISNDFRYCINQWFRSVLISPFLSLFHFMYYLLSTKRFRLVKYLWTVPYDQKTES